MVIEYAPGDPALTPPKLYVPVTESHLVSKYVGAGKARPPLNTLGGVRWSKAKEQAGRAVRDVAAELLQIQAVRETQPGHAFPPDVPWQREFEGAFIYEETPDQLRAIGETMTVMMVTGNAPVLALKLGSLFSPVRTMTATIAAEMGEVANGSTHYHVLFFIGMVLFVISLGVNIAASSIVFRAKKRSERILS